MFDLRTSKRVYYLVACTEEEMNKWVECICSVCGLKIEATTLSPSELSPLLASQGAVVNGSAGFTEQLTTSNNSTEERYSPQPSVSGDSLGPTMMAPTPPPQPQIAVPSTVALPPLQQAQPSPPSQERTHSQSASPLSHTKAPSNALPNTMITEKSLNDALLNYIPISECYTGTKANAENIKHHHSPPPPRPPKPRALQLAGKSQSSLALWPSPEVAVSGGNSRNSPVNTVNNLSTLQAAQLPPPHPLKAMMMANSLANGTDTVGRRSSPLQYSKSLQVNNSNGPPVFINDRPMGQFSYNAGTLPPSHSHNYEFCNANVVMGANGTFEVPPMVNRNLKPHRRSSGRTGSMDSRYSFFFFFF